MDNRIAFTCYSDVLCIWAHIAQARINEVARQYPEQVAIQYRFCSVFGDTAHKIGLGWADRGGYQGFGKHVQEAAAPFEHVRVHPEIWQRTRPASSTPAHLVLKAVQQLDDGSLETVLRELRPAFFERCLDIGQWSVLQAVLERADVSVSAVREALNSGAAHAGLEADIRDKAALAVQGSPTIILNEGRQKLYGNVGYGVIDANIRELLRSPTTGAASWC